mmetsp:Transcript_37521/g.105956  ORF Transcript_37521/g.105956 Transcript_37521/m.105956 type:complete len:572 (+) Transcript_37521:85-1800(+)
MVAVRASTGLFMLAAACQLLATAPAADAFSPYAEKIPNGHQVPLPDGSPGFCRGVGHLDCNGGGDRNPFGKDFAAASHQWTADLCRKDSDGDGFSNGQELGDPCCRWTPGSKDDNVLGSDVSHPGFQSSVLLRAQSDESYDCSNQTTSGIAGESEKEPDQVEFWQSGEERLTQTLQFNVTVPTNETTYIDVLYDFEFNADEEAVSLVGFEAIVDQDAGLLHHVVIHGCPFSLPHDGISAGDSMLEDSSTGSSNGPNDLGCYDQLWVFVPGMGPMVMPDDVGFRVGAGTPYLSVVVQIHYWNPAGVQGVVDKSGVMIHYTPARRQHDAAIFSFGPVLLHFNEIPPGESSYGYSSRCLMQTLEDATVFSAFPHMHLKGRRLWSEVVARGVGISDSPEIAPVNGEPLGLIARDDAFVYDLPSQIDIRNVTIRSGDLVATTCVFDTSGETKPVRGGYATKEEMCINFVYFYPASAIPFKGCNHAYTMADSAAPFTKPWNPKLSSVVQDSELYKAMLAPSDLGTFPTNGEEGSASVSKALEAPTAGGDDSHAMLCTVSAGSAVLLTLLALSQAWLV